MSLTPKILRLIVHATGAITTYGETGEELGYHLESGVTEIRFFLPSTVLGLHHHIYVKQPDGTILISPVLTEYTNDEILQGAYVKVDVGDPITSQVGRVKLEYVGNDANENRVFLSASKNMDIDESIYGEYCASENGSWDSEWQKDIDDLEQRVVEAEQKVDEAKAEAEAATSTAQGAVTTANAAEAKADAAVASAGQANTKADGAISTANAASSAASSAVSTAGQASTKADTAISTANQAKSVAEGIDAKATQALTQSGQAVTTAQGAVTTANAASATAGQASTKADTAIGTANAASTAAAGAVATANQTKQDVEGFFTAKEGLPAPYLKLNATKVGGTMTVHAKVQSTSLFKIEYFHGKNLIAPSLMTIGGDSRHPAAAFSPFIPCLTEFMYLTLPSGWKAYVTEFDCLAYKSSGNLVHESSFTESGLVALTPSNIGKSFRVYLTKLVDETEVIPSASELASIDPLTQLEFGTEPTSHEPYVAPREIIPASCAIDSDNVIALDSHYGYLGIVPQTGESDASLPVLASSLDDLTKTHVSFITDNVADEVNRNTIRNEDQDASIADHEARIKALEQTSGNEVFGTQFTGLSTVAVRLLSAAGKEFDLSQGKNDFQSVMPFLNIQEVDELSYDPSTGNEILDPNGGHLVNKLIYFPDLYLQLTTITNASSETVQTLYVSTVARSGYTKIPHFLYGKYAGAWRASDASDWIGSFSGKQQVANYAWTGANSKMVGIKDPALGLNEVTRLWPVPDARAYSAIAFLLFTLIGNRNAQGVFRGICDETWNDRGTVVNWGNSGTNNNLVVPSSHYLYGLAVGDTFTIFLNGDRWETRTVTAVAENTPSANKKTFTFDGSAVNWDSGTIYVQKACGELTGATDSVAGDFATLGQDGRHPFKVFGIENLYGNIWTPLASVVIKQTFDGTVGHNELCVRDYSLTFSASGYDSYPATGLETPNVSSNYVKEVGFAEGVLMTTVIGGGASSSAAWCDYCYTNTRTSAGTSYKQVLVGGNCAYGSNVGPVYFFLIVDWGYAYLNFGLRPFLPLP